ncbi:murein transglycosylase A [Lutibaculum baratangense]|uniref:peptidoglycan lytic exotransglycosylase n=1 Tax=Lutibaculum baratangense AMV1 TaxID=631454 RepID=V4TJF9_9HYPH|nr:MltA domain-containing protein [Lutibaculum baratangense]ESR26048.1 Membrane-bound lytic murein transglycosylase A precursor [Lutibaculum baratangense AMV1]
MPAAPGRPPGGGARLGPRAVAGALLGLAVVVAAALFLHARLTVPPPAPLKTTGVGLTPLAFSEIEGWEEDDHGAALETLRRSCLDGASRDGTPFHRVCRRLAEVPANAERDAARSFFEHNFAPFALEPPGNEGAPGLLTGYYEPVIPGSRERTERFTTPLYRLPQGHVVVTDGNRPEDFDPALVAGREEGDRIVAYPTRGEIEAGALADELEPLVWLENPVEAFFVHVQGSTRIALPDGSTMRIGYAGKTGHPYTSIGRHMREAGIEPPGGLGMTGLRGYLLAHPEEGREIMAVNRSFIFFREVEGLSDELGPVGAEGVPLTAKRSIAVDDTLYDYGLPIFVDADFGPLGRFRQLTIAQDTGSAIRGVARGDIFWGTGPEAGEEAGQIQAPARFVALLPL